MPIPLLAIAQALAGGATIVAHSSGGVIASSAGSYIAGTFISSAVLAQLLWSVAAIVAASLAWLAGLPALIIGGPGIFGTTIGATGATGFLMKAGIISSTPIWVPIAIALIPVMACLGLWRWWSLRKRLASLPPGTELVLSHREARFVHRLLVWMIFWRRTVECLIRHAKGLFRRVLGT